MFDDAGESASQGPVESVQHRAAARETMLSAFRSESPQLVLRIQSGAVEGRYTHVRHCARYLRSVSLEIGASSLADVCGEIEQISSGENTEVPVAVLHDLFVHWLAAITLLGGDEPVRH